MTEKMYGKLYNAFANNDTPFGVKPIGNPVVALVCSNFPHEKIMESIAIDFGVPIICFLKCDSVHGNNVEIRYYCGNGKEVNLCGHGTFGSTKFIGDYFGFKENDVIFFTPHYEKYTYLESQTIIGIIEKNGYSIVFPKLEKKILEDEATLGRVCLVLGISNENVEKAFLSNLDDIILILNNAEQMRKIKPNYAEMLKLADELGMSDLRAIMTSVVSDQEGYDFEARVFAPWIDADEDVACGSANCSLAHYWSDYLGKRYMKMFYPYTVYYDKTIGGVQNIEILNDKLIKISSDAYIRKAFEIEHDIDKNKYDIYEIKGGERRLWQK